jgi:hypothetical protein
LRFTADAPRSGHTAAPPSAVMNSRRPMPSMASYDAEDLIVLT